MPKSKKIRGFRIDESKNRENWFKDVNPNYIETIILYHGTSTLFLDSILKEGLKPRKETGVSNWVPHLESHPDFVYFGTRRDAESIGGKGYDEQMTNDKEHQVIMEVEVDTKNLYPDTDTMGLAKTWYESFLQVCGVAYKGSILPEKIQRVWKRINFPFKPSYKLIVDNTKNKSSN
jgi:hypothetical protein